MSGFIRPPFRLRRNRAGRSSAPPGPLFCRSRHGCAAPGPQRQNPGACRRSAPFRCAKPRWPVVAPAGGNVLATPFSLRSNVAPRSHPGACRHSAPFRCAKPPCAVVRFAAMTSSPRTGILPSPSRLRRAGSPTAKTRPLLPFGRISPAAKPGWPVVAPAGGNVLATPFSLCSNVAPHFPAGSAGVRSFVPRLAPRSHPGAQLRFILKQLYASGCPFLRNFPFFSSVPHPFFASAPGRTDTQKSAAGIPRRGFNTFSVSWLYFPLPNT